MASQLLLCVLLACLPTILAQEIAGATLGIDGSHAVAHTDDNYVCATIDWWPHNKCNYDQCPWRNSSIMNLNLSHPLLAKAVQAFGQLRLRLGGSMEDQVLYGVPSLKLPCHSFWKQQEGLFGFSRGCLHLDRWDALNQFFKKTGAIVTFGINALHGRQKSKTGLWTGSWDSNNALDFMKYTISKGYQIDSWEFGNELSGSGVGARVHAAQYGKDLIKLNDIINELYKNSHSKPSLLAPGGFFDQDWFTQLLQTTGSGVVNSVTHHIYNLGAGDDPNLMSKMLDPHFLSRISETFSAVNKTIEEAGPWARAWVGEAGGAYNSGGHLVSDTFVNSFWYLDQLGQAATYNTKVYCRQTLIGGNYGLLDTTTFVPNPDYYSALLWNRLMGRKVLPVDLVASPHLRSYAHCTKEGAGITVLLVNLSRKTSFVVKVQNIMNKALHISNGIDQKEGSLMRSLKKTVSWVGSKASDGQLDREEYHLTPRDGNIQSQTMVLNGNPLRISENGDIPTLEPALVSPLFRGAILGLKGQGILGNGKKIVWEKMIDDMKEKERNKRILAENIKQEDDDKEESINKSDKANDSTLEESMNERKRKRKMRGAEHEDCEKKRNFSDDMHEEGNNKRNKRKKTQQAEQNNSNTNFNVLVIVVVDDRNVIYMTQRDR